MSPYLLYLLKHSRTIFEGDNHPDYHRMWMAEIRLAPYLRSHYRA
jgi:hypothetical protein